MNTFFCGDFCFLSKETSKLFISTFDFIDNKLPCCKKIGDLTKLLFNNNLPRAKNCFAWYTLKKKFKKYNKISIRYKGFTNKPTVFWPFPLSLVLWVSFRKAFRVRAF